MGFIIPTNDWLVVLNIWITFPFGLFFHIFQRGRVKSHQWENPPFLIGKPR
jgi:hypothetical protein